MTFHSLTFIAFLALTVLIYYLLPHKARNVFILIASYFFYGVYAPPLLSFLIICTLVNWFFGRMIHVLDDQPTKKFWTIVAIVINIGTLGFFKYLNFTISIFESIAKLAGFQGELPRVDLLVPLGISFLIFQTTSYIIDVYRGKIKAERSLFHFALYVSFFPKVVQGPITRAGDIIPQFKEKHYFDIKWFREGFLQVLFGLFMKLVIADRAAIAVNSVYGSVGAYTGFALLIASFLFSLQIYFDFAAYSEIAIGSARMLGFHIKPNFLQPYLSTSIGEFWRRWHISLNEWLIDYLYIPLGGSRCSERRRKFNTYVTFGLSGLWHGANWGYIIWGLLNAFYVNVERKIFKRKKKDKHTNKLDRPDTKFTVFRKRIVSFFFLTIAWIFFRAETLKLSARIIYRIFFKFEFMSGLSWMTSQFKYSRPCYGLTGQNWIIMLIGFAIVLIIDLKAQDENLVSKVANAKLGWRWVAFLLLIFAIIIEGIYGYGYSASNFIYAQF